MATKKIEPPQSIGKQLNFTTGRMNTLCQLFLDPYGISLPQWAILSCLWREGDLTVGKLAELVGTGFPATSRIVDRMVDRGLVARRKHDTDGRVIVITLMDKGQELDHLSDFHNKINAVLFDGFSEGECQLVFDLLERMKLNAENRLR